MIALAKARNPSATFYHADVCGCRARNMISSRRGTASGMCRWIVARASCVSSVAL
jgi:hypothetical protein